MAKPVFDEHEGDYVTSDRLGSVRRDANKFLATNGFPFKVKLSVKQRKAELVKLRFFAGLTNEQAARALGVSEPTAKRDWAYARAWLFRQLNSA